MPKLGTPFSFAWAAAFKISLSLRVFGFFDMCVSYLADWAQKVQSWSQPPSLPGTMEHTLILLPKYSIRI